MGKLQTESICPTVCLFICYSLRLFPETLAQLSFFSPLYILFSELTHGNLKNWNSKTSKLPLCVGSIFHWHQNVTSTFITGLDNKPPSRGLLLSGGFSVPIMSGYNSATWENLAPLQDVSFFPSFCPNDNSWGYTFKLKKKHLNFCSRYLWNA